MSFREWLVREPDSLGVAVERIAAVLVDHAGRFERRLEIAVNDRPGLGIGIVDPHLCFAQVMFEDFVLDPGEGQRTGEIEALRLEVAGDEFHRRDAASADLGHESLVGRESSLGSPETKPGCVAKVGDIRSASGRRVEHPGARQMVLQPEARHALFGAPDLAAV